MSEQIDHIVNSIPAVLPPDRRYVIAIAGPPGSGKSTLAAGLLDRLGDTSAILGLDAYHYDNAVLESRGLLDRKGSIATFDPNAYQRDLTAVREQAQETLSVPVFDRTLELSRNCAEVVTPSQQIIITEGNYLLIENEPWATLGELFDFTIWLDVPIETLRSRLIDRWLTHGFDDAKAARRAEHNDLPNAEYILANSGPADHLVTPW